MVGKEMELGSTDGSYLSCRPPLGSEVISLKQSRDGGFASERGAFVGQDWLRVT